MPRPRQSDHAHVKGMVWASRVTSIAMQMAVPSGVGYLADRHWGTTPWFTILGASLGGLFFVLEIIRLARGVAGHDLKRTRGDRRSEK
ncbi:MAG: AtpZ/AtpI family protein [Planctomycetaceae bacterium]|nr:AtpZ/AtpI family protein [Planctomycetaceae bacterium]